MTKVNRLLALAMVGTCLGATAHADTGVVVLTGNGGERERRTVALGVDVALRDAGWTLPSTPLAAAAEREILRCAEGKEPWACLGQQPASRTLNQLFIVTIENTQSEAGAPIVAVTGKLLAREQKATVVRQRFCEQCADDKLTTAGHEVAVEALRNLAARSGSTVVQISSVPSGASIVLDGTRVGITDASFPTFPGEHTVVIAKPGFAPETRAITVAAGTTATVEVKLRENAARPGPGPSRVLPLIVMGAGAAAVLAGATMLVLDEDEEDAGPQDATYTNRTPYGIAYVVGGLVVGGVGAYLWHRASRSQSRPAVAVTADGATLGWGGSF